MWAKGQRKVFSYLNDWHCCITTMKIIRSHFCVWLCSDYAPLVIEVIGVHVSWNQRSINCRGIDKLWYLHALLIPSGSEWLTHTHTHTKLFTFLLRPASKSPIIHILAISLTNNIFRGIGRVQVETFALLLWVHYFHIQNLYGPGSVILAM